MELYSYLWASSGQFSRYSRVPPLFFPATLPRINRNAWGRERDSTSSIKSSRQLGVFSILIKIVLIPLLDRFLVFLYPFIISFISLHTSDSYKDERIIRSKESFTNTHAHTHTYTRIGELAKEAKNPGLPLPLPSPTMANNSRRLIKGQPLRLADDPGWRRASLPSPSKPKCEKKRREIHWRGQTSRWPSQEKKNNRWKTNRLPALVSLPILPKTRKKGKRKISSHSSRSVEEIRNSSLEIRFEARVFEMVAFSSRSRKCHRSIIQSERMLSSIPFGNKVRFISILFDVFFSFRRS